MAAMQAVQEASLELQLFEQDSDEYVDAICNFKMTYLDNLSSDQRSEAYAALEDLLKKHVTYKMAHYHLLANS